MKSNPKKNRHVMIKGTKDGLTFLLDDQCTLEALKKDLQEMLSERPEVSRDKEQAPVKAKLITGKRYMHERQVAELEALFSDEMNVMIDSIESDVMTKAEAEDMAENRQINRIVKMVRSGQVLELKGDLLLIGDVNPGGTVKATGNIYILGSLRGIAHAGYLGDSTAVICASAMTPSQLRIASLIRRSPEEKNSEYETAGLECAYVNGENEMIIDKLQVLSKIRPGLSMDVPV